MNKLWRVGLDVISTEVSSYLRRRGNNRSSPAAWCWYSGGNNPADTPGCNNLHTKITQRQGVCCTNMWHISVSLRIHTLICNSHFVMILTWCICEHNYITFLYVPSPIGMKRGWSCAALRCDSTLPSDTLNVLLQSAGKRDKKWSRHQREATRERWTLSSVELCE